MAFAAAHPMLFGLMHQWPAERSQPAAFADSVAAIVETVVREGGTPD
jgi:hypothetical protein